jgi:hypothetical protein
MMLPARLRQSGGDAGYWMLDTGFTVLKGRHVKAQENAL